MNVSLQKYQCIIHSSEGNSTIPLFKKSHKLIEKKSPGYKIKKLGENVNYEGKTTKQYNTEVQQKYQKTNTAMHHKMFIFFYN